MLLIFLGSFDHTSVVPPMKMCVNFKSDLFKPFLPEESQVNPGRYGAELTYWLSRKLSEKGIITSYPEYEDWGWFIEFTTEEGD